MTLRELLKILRNAEKIRDIDKYRDKIVDLIPKIAIMVNYDQQNYAHQYNLWEHCLHTVVGLPKDIEDDMVYMAALLHDIGKPYCRSVGEHDGKVNMHYYGHPLCSMKLVRDEIIPNLAEQGEMLDEDEKRRLIYYVEYHDDRVSLRIKHLKRHLKLGVSLKEFQTLMKLQVSDAKAHVLIPPIQERIAICEKLSGEYSEELYNTIEKDKTDLHPRIEAACPQCGAPKEKIVYQNSGPIVRIYCSECHFVCDESEAWENGYQDIIEYWNHIGAYISEPAASLIQSLKEAIAIAKGDIKK